ncbi:MAG TPA: hypothetical protein VGG33_23280 [Polyangia bacterium]
MPPAASAVVTFGIPGIALLTAGLLIAGTAVAEHRLGTPPERRRRNVVLVAVACALWLLLTGLLAARGILARTDTRPPVLAPFMASMLVVSLAWSLSPFGARLARGLPVWVMIMAQSFRLPLELVMHQAAREEVMPAQLSFSLSGTGFNFDIVVGMLALPVGWLVATRQAPLWLPRLWNLLGFVTLAVIAGIAIATSPMVHAFGTAPKSLNTWVMHFPFVWLPAGAVVFALGSHIVIARALRHAKRDWPRPDEEAAAALRQSAG